jgi:hypothetical protein
MDTQNIDYIIPLGNTNPTEHTLPTSHIYLLFKDPNATYDVYFPASGELHAIDSGTDYSVTVKCSTSFKYSLGHIQAVEPAFVPYIGNDNISGVTVAAGQKVGTTGKNSQGVVAMDLGVVDTDVTRSGFINSGNYLEGDIHCGAPLSYYVEPIKSTLKALVSRVGTSDKDGQIDYDQAGKLIGNWFATDLIITDPTTQIKSDSYHFGTKQISFVYYNRNATLEVVSIGGEITGEGVSSGLYAVPAGATLFENVSSSTGLVSYELYAYNDLSTKVGNLIVRYNADDTISVEASSASLSNFSSSVITYTR